MADAAAPPSGEVRLGATALRLPEPIALAVRCGAVAELLTDARTAAASGSPPRLMLRILDFHELAQRASRREGDGAEEFFASRVAAARETLRTDEFIGRLLPTSDADCWPPPEQLSEIVRHRVEFASSPATARALRAAFALHRVATEAAGLHALEDVHGRDAAAAGAALYSVAPSAPPTGVPQWQRCEPAPPRCVAAEHTVTHYEVATLLAAPAPVALQRLAPAALGLPWARLLAVHAGGAARGQPLCWSLEDMSAALRLGAPRAVQLLGDAAAAGRKLRVRSGAFVTAVSFPRLHVVLRSAARRGQGLTDAETEAVSAAIGAPIADATRRGTVLYAACGARELPGGDDTALEEVFAAALSPLATPTRLAPTRVSSTLAVATVEATNNTFCIFHGPRMRRQLPPLESELDVLRRRVVTTTTRSAAAVPSASAGGGAGPEGPHTAATAQQPQVPSSSLADHLPVTPEEVQRRVRLVLAAGGGTLKKQELLQSAELLGLPRPAVDRALSAVAVFDRKSGWKLRL